MTNQFNDVKRQLIDKSNQIEVLQSKSVEFDNLTIQYDELLKKFEKLEKLNAKNVKKDAQVSPRKQINTKNIVPPPVVEEEKADDF